MNIIYLYYSFNRYRRNILTFSKNLPIVFNFFYKKCFNIFIFNSKPWLYFNQICIPTLKYIIIYYIHTLYNTFINRIYILYIKM